MSAGPRELPLVLPAGVDRDRSTVTAGLTVTAGSWADVDLLADRAGHAPEVSQTRAWQAFVCETQGGSPVVLRLTDGGELVGAFAGVVVRRFGVRVLGAPLPGWTTQYMGPVLLPGVGRSRVTSALLQHASRVLRCRHVEICDRWAEPADLRGLPVAVDLDRTFVVDLDGSEEEIFGRMRPGCRQNLRKAQRSGVVVEQAGPEGFAEEFHAQLVDVFAKQGLAPTYPVERVRALIAHLHPEGMVDLLRARSADGTSLATAVVPRLGRSAAFWGGASWRAHQNLRPNELMLWEAFLRAKRAGASEFDFAGRGEYKRKYGVREVAVPHLRWSASPVLEHLRTSARHVYAVKQRAAFALRAARGS